MTIQIATGATGVTKTEAASWFGRAVDGLTALVGTDDVTHNEHFASSVVIGVGAFAAGSMYARSRQSQGLPPILKFFG